MTIVWTRIRARLAHTAKAVAAVATPIVVTAALEAIDDLRDADLAQPWPLVLTVLATGLAVYRVPNAPKP